MNYLCKLLLIASLFTGYSAIAQDISKITFMKAKEVHYDADKELITAYGGVVIQQGQYILVAEKIKYDIKMDIVFAPKGVKITDGSNNNVIYGSKAIFKDKLKQGMIKEFIAKLDQDSVIAANLAKRANKDKMELRKTVFSPCHTYCRNNPIWQIKSDYTEIDYNKEQIIYRHLFFEVYGVPIAYMPYFFHPTPRAQAKSGILRPQVKMNGLLIPFYFRLKPNFDFTISPRFNKKYTIVEGEVRHRVQSGQYNISGSYGNPVQQKQDADNNNLQKSRPQRYYLTAKGDFVNEKINFGFDIKGASDKAYLTNYNEIFDSYFASEAYVNSINARDYVSIEAFHFQDLRASNLRHRQAFVFPYITARKVISLDEQESVLFNVKNNTIAYKNDSNLQMLRTATDLELMTSLVSSGGQIMTYTISNRSDLYLVDFTDSSKQKMLYRNIPEASSRFRYPLIKAAGQDFLIKLEPNVLVVFGRKFEDRFNKYGMIDSNKIELSENNIFNSNKFSGIDFHDYGTRISYGMSSSIMRGNYYLDTFLGQSLHKYNNPGSENAEFVGSATINFVNQFDLFYQFRKDKKLSPIINEIGAAMNTEKAQGSVTFIQLHKIQKYFAQEKLMVKHNNLSQLSFSGKYAFVPNLLLGLNANIDISANRARVLARTIQVTYIFDCVSINAKITDNFLADKTRGIKKNRSTTFSIGLKAINM